MRTSDIVVLVLYVICFICLFAAVTIFIRNNRVFKHRMETLDRVFQDDTDDWKVRVRVFDAVSYGTMLLKFWKPLDSFYPKGFLDSLPPKR